VLNYYQHHIGDYAQSTAHLSFVEDAAYSRLMRKYYATEVPLPADLKAVQRLVGARTREERVAVQNVLAEFFTLSADGWHNKRCDQEIAELKARQDSARRSARARWDAQPPADADAMRSHPKRNANASETQCDGNANPMLSNLQSPILRSESVSDISSHPESYQARAKNPRADVAPRNGKKSAETGTRVPEPFELSEDMRAWAQEHTPHVDLEAATAEFVDYWRGIPGARGRKLDWAGTWRNRMREVARVRRNGAGEGGKSKQLTDWERRKEALKNA